MKALIDLVCKNIANPDVKFKKNFYKSQHYPYIVDKYGKVCRLSRARRLGEWIDRQRIVCGYRINNWVPVDYVYRHNGTIINVGDTIRINAHDPITIGGHTYVGHIDLVNIENVANIEFAASLYKIRCYNTCQRDPDVEQAIDNINVRVYEGTSNIPHIEEEIDGVIIPGFHQYTNSVEYYETLFHELTHYIRARDMVDQRTWRDYDVYCCEEIIAELTATMIAKKFGLDVDYQNSANYIITYMRALTSPQSLNTKQLKHVLKTLEIHATLTYNHMIDMMM